MRGNAGTANSAKAKRRPAPPGLDRVALGQVRKLSHYVRPYTPLLLVSTVLLTIGSVAGLLIPWVTRFLIDSVFVGGNLQQLNMTGLLMLGLSVIQGVLSLGQGWINTYVNKRLVIDLRLAVEERLLSLPLRYFNDHRVGELVSRMTSDVSYIQGILTDTPLTLWRLAITLVGGLWLMWKMNHQLTMLVFVVIPPLVFMTLIFSRQLRRLAIANQDILAEAIAVLQETLSGIRVVKAFASEDFERKRFKDRLEEGFQVDMKQQRLQSTFSPFAGLLGFLPAGLILWYASRLISLGKATPGELVAFLGYEQMVVGIFFQIGFLYSSTRQSLAAAQRIFEILEYAPEPQTAPGLPVLPPLAGSVGLRNVSFAYEPGRMVLENVSFDVLPSQVVALVGSSGVGKTTLVNLIPRFYDPTEGHVLVDGHDVSQVNLRSLRLQIGLVPQETFLFAGTVRANIEYGRPGASEAEIVSAARAAFAHDFIADLPQGYDTLLGERGIRLSAGQRQRIAIARALLKDPRILILDEATSALDTESERYVQAALDVLMQGRTTIAIAHRLSTIKRADRILVLQNGRIAEDGTHSVLLAQGGVYARLWNLQFADSEPVAPVGATVPALAMS